MHKQADREKEMGMSKYIGREREREMGMSKYIGRERERVRERDREREIPVAMAKALKHSTKDLHEDNGKSRRRCNLGGGCLLDIGRGSWRNQWG